jgi:hypothetical protein
MSMITINITLKIDASALRELHRLAAEEGTSVTAMLSASSVQIVHERKSKSYEQSRRRALARLRKGMNFNWTRPRNRGELYDR